MDSIIVFPPGASAYALASQPQIQLGSWLDPEVGVDYGAQGLIQSIQAGNALVDGGRFGYRHGAIRKMAIPLIVNTPSPVMWEGMLARAAQPGAMIAVQPELVPSAQAVFFDVIDGRYEPAHNLFHNRVGVHKGVLHLETQPYGYWPTEILLASAASVGWNGALAVNGASIIGDVPPLAHVIIQPTAASCYMPTGSWFADMAAWSLSARPSFAAMIPANKFVFVASPPIWGQSVASGYFAASLSGDQYAPGSQAWVLSPSTVQVTGARIDALMPWTQLFSSSQGAIPSALSPAYRGRFRVFAFARTTPSEFPWNMIVDAIPAGGLQALASANQLATMAQPAFDGALPYVATGWFGGPSNMYGILSATALVASPAYQIMDCGEMTLPPNASGFQGPIELRVWAAMGPSGANDQSVASMQVRFGGLFLLPVDGAAGILTGGLAYPSVAAWGATIAVASDTGNASVFGYQGASPASMFQGQFEMGAQFTDSFLVTKPGASQALADVRALHRGVSPRLDSSTSQLVLLLGDKRAGASAPIVHGNYEFAAASVSYRPLFQFLYGV